MKCFAFYLIVFCTVLVLPAVAQTGDAYVDFGPIMQTFLALILAAMTAAMGVAANYLRQHTSNSLLQNMITNVQTAADAAAGMAYNYGASQIDAGGLSHVAVKDAAMAKAVNYMLAKVPNDINGVGLTTVAVHDMVEARLGKLLAMDPTVSAVGYVPPISPVKAMEPWQFDNEPRTGGASNEDTAVPGVTGPTVDRN